METHRTVHDFAELTYEDIGQPSSAPRRVTSANPYYFLFSALALGILLGFLARRK